MDEASVISTPRDFDLAYCVAKIIDLWPLYCSGNLSMRHIF